MVKRKLALRWGIVPSTKNNRAERQAHVVYYLLEYHGLGTVMQYLEQVSFKHGPSAELY